MIYPDEEYSDLDAIRRAVVLLTSLEDGTLKRMLEDIAFTLDMDGLPEFQTEVLQDWYAVIQAELDGPMPSTDEH